jgi:alcohol dehydrogenase YqhD (iron-dependent ADH family)
LLERGLPFIAVPTTAGTGSEVTRNAVLEVPEHQVKASLRSPHLLARLAVVDPELTLSLPPAITAYTGMDALTQLIEPFVSNAANPLTDGVCRVGFTRAARSLVRAYRDGSDVAAREDLALAALSAASPWLTPGWAPCTGSPVSWAGAPAMPMVPSAPGSSPSSWRPTFARSTIGATRPSCSGTSKSPGP